MKADIKEKIRQAAELKRRTMADWARLELELAAESVIAAHAAKNTSLPPLAMVAETHHPPLSPPRKQVTYPKAVKQPNRKSNLKKQA